MKEHTIQVSKHESAFGLVQMVVKYIRDPKNDWKCPEAPSEHPIWTAMALPYFTGINNDPWGSSYPDLKRAAEIVTLHTGIRIELIGN